MTHRRARRLVFALPDGLLSVRLEARLRRHVAGCPSCHRVLSDVEASERLLRGLPTSLVPLEESTEAGQRLALLARWSEAHSGSVTASRTPAPRWALPTFGAVSAAACLAVMLLLGAPDQITARAGEGQEAFNFVLASSFDPAGRPLGRVRPTRAGVATLGPSPGSGTSDLYYLPIGVR